MEELCIFLSNTKGAKWRKAKLEGRTHVVVPTVMLLQGVFAGSDGPVYYPDEELGKDVTQNNHRPLVVYHPEMNGKGVSACSADVLSRQKVGITLNSAHKKGVLRTESWIDEARADAVDPRILKAIYNNEMVEVSTGLYVRKVVGDKQTFNGREYTVTARDLRLDHLAILPDGMGACSIKDGAGLLRNALGDVPWDDLSPAELLAEYEAGLDRYLNLSGAAVKEFDPVTNAVSYGNTHRALSKLLSDTYGYSAYVQDVYPGFLIYSKSTGDSSNRQLFKVDYKSKAGKFSIEGTPVAVEQVIEYRTGDGKFIGNSFTPVPNRGSDSMSFDKKKHIDDLIANTASGYVEADRDELMKLGDAVLQKIKAPAPAVVVPPTPVPVVNTAPVVPAPVALTVEQYIANAPPGLREVLAESHAAQEKEKADLIAAITANASAGFNPEWLKDQPLMALRGMMRLAGKTTPNASPILANYAGAGGPSPVPVSLPMPAAMPTPEPYFKRK